MIQPMKWFRKAKERFPDTLLLLSYGGRWRAFEDDAAVCRATLAAPLATIEIGGQPVQVASIDDADKDAAFKKLLEAGHRVAECRPVVTDHD